jgi:hypothetical protein
MALQEAPQVQARSILRELAQQLRLLALERVRLETIQLQQPRVSGAAAAAAVLQVAAELDSVAALVAT